MLTLRSSGKCSKTKRRMKHLRLLLLQFASLRMLGPLPKTFRTRLVLDSLSDAECLRRFRFRHDELDQLVLLLEIPNPYKILTCNLPAKDALCMLLYRLAGTRSTWDVADGFGVSQSYISKVTVSLVDFMTQKWAMVVKFNKARMIRSLPLYAAAIRASGASLSNCVGFIDGTNREVARPRVAQGAFYSGHKSYHSIKFQSWVTPDGLISHLFGPVPGARHDLFMFDMSGVEEIMSEPEFNMYCLFSDQGYHNNGHLLSPIPGVFLTEQEQRFNQSMILPRLSVEWGFMIVSQSFSFLTTGVFTIRPLVL
jgi:hypothetical protein